MEDDHVSFRNISSLAQTGLSCRAVALWGPGSVIESQSCVCLVTIRRYCSSPQLHISQGEIRPDGTENGRRLLACLEDIQPNGERKRAGLKIPCAVKSASIYAALRDDCSLRAVYLLLKLQPGKHSLASALSSGSALSCTIRRSSWSPLLAIDALRYTSLTSPGCCSGE